jgi:hypothetical protein
MHTADAEQSPPRQTAALVQLSPFGTPHSKPNPQIPELHSSDTLHACEFPRFEVQLPAAQNSVATHVTAQPPQCCLSLPETNISQPFAADASQSA